MILNHWKKIAAALTVTIALGAPAAAFAQDYGDRHERAVQAQRRHDHRHHTGAKIVGGSAVGGAVVGGLLGGPKGALIGAGVGAGGGAIVNHQRVKHDVKKREHHEY